MNSRMKFYKRGAILTAVSLAMRTVSMFFGAFISSAVGAEGVGIYTLVMTVYSFAVTLATSGVSLTVTRLVAGAVGEGKPHEVGRIISGAVIYSALFGSLAMLMLFFGADLISSVILGDAKTVSSLKVLAVSLIPIAIGSVFSGYFVGVKRVSANAVVQVLAQLSKILLTVLLVRGVSEQGVEPSVRALCLGITLAEIIAFAIIFLEFLYDRHKYGIRARDRMPEIPSVAKNALPLAASAYVRSVLLNIEHILIPRKLRERGESDSEAYSHYGLLHGMALPLILYPMSPLSSFAGLLVPEFAEDESAGNFARMKRIATEAMNKTLSYATVCAVFIYFFAEELGYAVYHSYDAGYYISTLSFVIPIMYLDHVTDSILKGVGEQVFSMWVNITDSCLSVILVWLLIPRLGIMGYAIVIVIMEGYNFLLSVTRLKKRIDFSIHPLRSVLLPFLSSFAACLVGGAAFDFGGSTATPLWLFLKILFTLCITVGIMAIVNIKNEKKTSALLQP